jgi:rod shape determining protein RodA
LAGQGVYLGRVESIGRQRVQSGFISAKHPLRHLDFSLFGVALALAAAGCIAIYSATRQGQIALGLDPNYYLKRQLAFVVLALGIFVISLLFDYRRLRHWAPVIYAGCVGLLVVVLSPIGSKAAGAQRWINVGILQVQPSEIMKLVLVLALAAVWAERGEDTGLPKILLALALVAVPAGLVYLQPDLGTVLVLLFVAFAIMLVSGTQLRWIGLLMALGAGAIFVVLHLGLLHSYQVQRITTFLNPNANTPAAYNLRQSKLTVSSGGFTGKGLFKGTQTNLDYVPENHTDFIFTVIGEETGFLGSLLVIGLEAFLIWRALRIASLSRDQFGARLAAGVAAMLAFQLFVNVGMTIGIVPIVGIPLPFISYGGSSLLTSFGAVGILMNVHMRRYA